MPFITAIPMDKLIADIELNLTDIELTGVLVIAQYAMLHPDSRKRIQKWFNLSEREVYALAHNVTEIVGKE